MAVGLTILLSSTLIKLIPKGTRGDEPIKEKIYGLHHAILNMDVPPKTMWMNMGYWEVGTAGDVALVVLLMVVT